MNAFEILHIKKSYNIDLANLEKKYLEMQMLYHPDRALSNLEKEYFLNLSIDINNSYKILKNDCDRAILLLNMEKIDHNSTKLPKEILEKILEKNEELINRNDASNIREFIHNLNNEYKNLYSVILSAFESKNYDLASSKTIEMKYISNLIIKAKEKLRCYN